MQEMKKAVIDIASKKIENIIVYSGDSAMSLKLPLTKMIYDCTNYNVRIGDTFKDGVFFRDGVPLEYNHTEADRLEMLEAALRALGGEV